VSDLPPTLITVGDGPGVGAPPVSLRRAESSDEVVLQAIFMESHGAAFEMMGLEPAALSALIGMQLRGRQAQYQTHPGAAEYLICRGAGPTVVPVGSCWLSDSPERLRVLDIAVLAEYRRSGIARAVLTELCGRAAVADKPIRLSVWHDNHPARALYRALGFRPDPMVGSDAGRRPGDLGNGYLELSRYVEPTAAHQ
jgi:ribosomal protein S18 acetylase RimI-like enzyme